MITVLDLLLAVFLSLVTLSLGRWLFALVRFSFPSFGEEAIFSLGLGLGALAFLTLFIGILGGLYRSVFYTVFFLLIILVHRQIVETGKTVVLRIRQFNLKDTPVFVLALMGILLLTLLTNLIGALAPPTGADTLAYHFAYPKQVVRAHEISYIPDFAVNAPLNQHMLYVMGMLLGRVNLASLIAYMQGMAVVAAILLFCRRHLRIRTGVLAAVLLYTMPVVTYMAGSGMVELGLTFFTFLAFWALYEWFLEHEVRWLAVASVFTGFAVGTKYYGLISLIAFPILIPIHLTWRSEWALKNLVKPVVLFACIAVLIGSPWYIRNAVNTGNPLYPAFHEILGGRDWSPELNAEFKSMIAEEKRQGGNDFLSFVLAPWNIVVHGDLFGQARVGFSPVFLAFAPVLIWLCYRDTSHRELLGYILIFSLVFFTVWFWMAFQRHRHLLPIMPGISITAAVAAFYLAVRSPLMKWATVAAIAVVLLFNLGGSVIFSSQFVPVVFGAESRESFLKSKVQGYKDILWINQHLSQTDRVLHFNRLHNYYLDVKYYCGAWLSQGRLDWSRIKSVEELIEKLGDEGITHVWVDEIADIEQHRYSARSDAAPSINTRIAEFLFQLTESHAEELYRDDRTAPLFRTFGRGERKVRSRVYRIRY